MKKLYTLFTLLLICLSGSAQRWIELGRGTSALNATGSIYSIISDPMGHVYAAGAFTEEAYDSAYVAQWSGAGWTELGTGATALHANGSIYSIARDGQGNIYAAGNFTDSNNRVYVAKWNGSQWSEIGRDTAGLNATAPIYALTTDAANRVYAAGAFGDQLFSFHNYYYVAVWDGRWTEVGFDTASTLRADSIIYAITYDTRRGYLYAAGAFRDTNGYAYVAAWDGSRWSELGTGRSALRANGAIKTVITDSAGHVYAAGDFTDSAGHYYIAEWVNGKWFELSSLADQISIRGPINALALDSAGNVYAGGMIPDSTGNYVIVAEWDGSRIIAADNGGRSPINADDAILSMCSDHWGNIYAAGNFKDDNTTMYVAEFTSNAALAIAPISSTSLRLYPNPTSGTIYLHAEQLSGTATVEIIDALGRVIHSQRIESSTIYTSIDLSPYATGVYTLTLRDAAGTTMRRIVKQ